VARLRWTARAEEDLIDIWVYIANANPKAADGVLDAIEHACLRLEDNPYLGPARPDLAPDLRYRVVGRYLIFYRIVERAVEIVRVIHGARHLPRLF
jgi:toxin ParE1/3/4